MITTTILLDRYSTIFVRTRLGVSLDPLAGSAGIGITMARRIVYTRKARMPRPSMTETHLKGAFSADNHFIVGVVYLAVLATRSKAPHEAFVAA
jgi:hypothetical protein